MITEREWTGVTRLLRDAGRAEVMPRFRKLSQSDIRTKTGPADLVTAADLAAEATITAGLLSMFPGCTVVGEEAVASDPAVLQRLAGSSLVFVVDPVDGTSNFVAGLPLFGMMTAAILNGKTLAAAIHDPVGNDTAVAIAGQGAWTEQGDGTRTPMVVAEAVPPHAMTGCVSWRYMGPALQSSVLRNLPRLGSVVDYRCAAHEYRMLAAGHCHYLVFNRLMPWDHLPGVLLHHEAGGFAARFDESPYRATDLGGGLICAPDRASYAAIRETLLDGMT